MQIALFSDTHSEFQRWHPPALPGVDVIVVAGDLGATPGHYQETLCDLREKNPEAAIITVLGNHEFYKGPALNDRQVYHDIAAQFHVTLLDNSHVTLNGVTFVGGTLWTNANVSPLAAQANTGDLLNDYNYIGYRDPDRGDTAGINTYLISQEWLKTKNFIFDVLNDCAHPVVVVTHHAPSRQSAQDNQPGRDHYARMSDFYCSNFDEGLRELGEYAPRAWLHGHVHASSDYRIGETRVVCNPRGYGPHNFNPDFQPAGARIVIL